MVFASAMRRGGIRLHALLTGLVAVSACTPASEPGRVPHGRLETINGHTVISVEGTPEQMGTAYGKLLGPTIRRVVKAMITDGVGAEPEAYANMVKGSKTMERFQPKDFLAELRAIAKAAGVAYDDLLLLQYFGDVRRCTSGAGGSFLCTSFAVLPPNTKERICLVGRNFDYFDNGVGEYASLIAYYRPQGKIPFVTLTWAGVINGWTLLNARGIVVSNNTAYGRSDSLEGMSTCNLLRYVAERAKTVDEGVELIKKGPRSCGTIILVASGRPPGGAIVEFDHAKCTVVRPRNGFVGAANSYSVLYQEDWGPVEGYWGRIGAAHEYVKKHKGKIDFTHNVAGAEGVPITSMNLHSANIDATNLRLNVAMGKIPACKLPYQTFRLTPRGLVGEAPATPARPKKDRPARDSF